MSVEDDGGDDRRFSRGRLGKWLLTANLWLFLLPILVALLLLIFFGAKELIVKAF